jgi:hypothetical protein
MNYAEYNQEHHLYTPKKAGGLGWSPAEHQSE